MIRIVALGLTYLALLFAFAAGIQALASKQCSDWLTNCTSEQQVAMQSSKPDDVDSRPEAPELR
ncbi:MAG: hypothetical protein QNI99_20615 [Woeseiaceae bacterium]|nr:hypothetical protein [Woeseiaceae bacterium]